MKPRPSVAGYLSIGLAACIGLAGCNEVGPLSIDQGRLRYNDVIERTAQAQLLQNLIRVSQNRAPLFIDVTEVDASLSFSSSLTAAVSGLGVGKKAGAFRVGSITSGAAGASVGYVESPTIRYIPLQGQALIQQLAAPISIDSLPELYDADVPLPTLLDFTVDRLTPGYYDYGAALDVIGRLDWLGALTMTTAAPRDSDDTAPRMGSDHNGSVIVQTVAPTPPRHTALELYLQPDSLTCRDTLQAARQWAELLDIYRTVRTEAQNADLTTLKNLLAPITGCEAGRFTTQPPRITVSRQALLAALRKVPVIELRTEPLKDWAHLRPSSHIDDPAPYLRMRSAYGIFRSIELSDYGPTELIEIVTPENEATITGMPWDGDQLFHLFTFQQYCAPGKPISIPKCKELGEIYQTQPPSIMQDIDRQICEHGQFIQALAERYPTNDVLQDKLRRWTQSCRRYRFTETGVPDETVFPPPLLAMSENDLSGPTELTSDRRTEERLLRKQRRYILIVESPDPPAEAYASVEVGGKYYYIATDDVISQKNFRLLQLISIMESVAPAPPLTPTVSVGGH